MPFHYSEPEKKSDSATFDFFLSKSKLGKKEILEYYLDMP